MKCPKCNMEVTNHQFNCHYCGYLFDRYYEKLYDDILSRIIYPIIIDETINKYSNISIKSDKSKHNDTNIIFKNISTDNNFQNKLSYEEFVIKFYRENGYKAFFAENKYWMTLLLMIYDYDYFVKSHSINGMISSYFPGVIDHIIGKINFNSIKDIPNITNQIIKAYFKNLSHTIPPNEINNYNDYYSNRRNNFKVGDFIATVSNLNEEQLILIFKRMYDDLNYYSYGFPDLIVYNDDEFFFVEVKSKDDKPSFKQIQWHKFLAEVVGIDVILFMLDKSEEQIINIKKSYDIKLEDSKKRKQKFKENQNKISIDWNSDSLKKHSVSINDDDFNKLFFLRHFHLTYGKYIVNDYTPLTRKDFSKEEWKHYRKLKAAKSNDVLYEKAKELYSINTFEDFTPTKKHFERNKKAKSLESTGNYVDAVNLYMQNVIERTGSPTTYKQLIYIFNKFDRFNDVINLMDIAMPIFITLNDKNNTLRFIYQRFAARNGNKYVPEITTLSYNDSKIKPVKNKSKQTDLFSY